MKSHWKKKDKLQNYILVQNLHIIKKLSLISKVQLTSQVTLDAWTGRGGNGYYALFCLLTKRYLVSILLDWISALNEERIESSKVGILKMPM